jgi:hypothetical protein
MNRGVILDTATESPSCDFCRESIALDEPKVILAFMKRGGQWFKFLHLECAKQSLDLDWEQLKKNGFYD